MAKNVREPPSDKGRMWRRTSESKNVLWSIRPRVVEKMLQNTKEKVEDVIPVKRKEKSQETLERSSIWPKNFIERGDSGDDMNEMIRNNKRNFLEL